jgi:hypothetical protein
VPVPAVQVFVAGMGGKFRERLEELEGAAEERGRRSSSRRDRGDVICESIFVSCVF